MGYFYNSFLLYYLFDVIKHRITPSLIYIHLSFLLFSQMTVFVLILNFLPSIILSLLLSYLCALYEEVEIFLLLLLLFYFLLIVFLLFLPIFRLVLLFFLTVFFNVFFLLNFGGILIYYYYF